jgi:hypothetical protein
MRARYWAPKWQTTSSPILGFCAGVWNWAGLTSSMKSQCSPPFCVCRMKATWMLCITCLYTCPCTTMQWWCLTLIILTLICALSSILIGSPCIGDAKEAITPNAPVTRGKAIDLHLFVDSDHAGEHFTRRSRTGFVIYLNLAPIVMSFI